jgi:hypothetical protein
MTPKRPERDRLNSAANAPESSRPESGAAVVAAANANEVMREQLCYLIEHAGSGPCGCRDCKRYMRAREVLMEIFA